MLDSHQRGEDRAASAHKGRDITSLLRSAMAGSETAHDEVYEILYSDLRERAGRLMQAQSRSHTLQPTALVHEAFVRLARREGVAWADRSHFLALAARAMRSVLVDHARTKRRAKRGGKKQHIPLDAVVVGVEDSGIDLLELDEALTRLADRDPQMSRIVELRFFAGMTSAEAARYLKLSTRTVEREWQIARAWLRRELR